MAEKKSKSKPDGSLIDMNQGYDVRYWMNALGVSRDRLEELVRQHGISADAIRQALKVPSGRGLAA